jgi:hypothetical protein
VSLIFKAARFIYVVLRTTKKPIYHRPSPGTDVMLLKVFSPKIFAKKLAF